MPHALAAAVAAVFVGLSAGAVQPGGEGGGLGEGPLDWKTLEAPLLRNHVQLTSRNEFVKAGEAYFSNDGSWIIFQAVPVPEEGEAASPHYAMYVAKLKRRGDGRVTGMERPILISPPGSANTCGWFHPSDSSRVMFGSTMVAPSSQERPGFQVGTRRYVWQFPEEMEIVQRHVKAIYDERLKAAGALSTGMMVWASDLETPKPIFSRPNYTAEGSWSADGRHILYTQVRDNADDPRPDGDIWIYDTLTKEHRALVTADGYDGGPFFSACGKFICYRSDRRGDNKLQLFVAELAFDAEGSVTGISREKQLTDDGHVNWAPYWHPSGAFIVYASSAAGHQNYEMFAVEVDWEKPIGELRTRRITRADGADVLPAFSNDGRLLMWTAQRGKTVRGEDRPSSQLWIAEVGGGPEAWLSPEP